MEDIRAIAQEILRAAADNHRGPTGKCRLDRRFRNSGDPARIQQAQPVGGRQASLKRATKKIFEDPVDDRIGSPFSPLNRLWRTFRQTCDFLCQPLVPQVPSKAACDQAGNLRSSAAELALNCDGVNHLVYPHPTATSPPAPGSFFLRKNERTNIMAQSTPKSQNVSMKESV